MTVKEILAQMNEPRPLPIGMTEFEVWADRIISGACLPETVGKDGLYFTLASIILTLKPFESHQPDAYFIHSLRKAAANQVAVVVQQESQKRVKARLAEGEVTKSVGSGGVVSLVKDTSLAKE